MSKNIVYSLFLVFVLMGVFGLAFRVQRVEASGTIYIRYNGLVEGTDKITNANNITYTFTDNINDSIVVERSNIMIDGAGYTFQGSGSENGFLLWGISNTTIRNADIKGFEVGVYIGSASKNIISQNNITENYYGITLWSASNNSIFGNNISWNDHIGINAYDSCNHNIISGNNLTDNVYTAIGFARSSNNSIIGNNIINSTYGFYHSSSNDNTMTGNNITENSYGIELYNSTYNSVYHNRFENNTVQVVCRENSTNFWDDGSEGNYWSDYEQKYPSASEIGNTGIWDTPYVIDADNTDHYPVVPEFPSLIILPLFMIATLLAVIVYRRKHTI